MTRRPVLFDLGGGSGKEAAEKKAAEEKAAEEKAAEEKAAREAQERARAARERADREKAERERAEREKAERDRAAKETAERERAERERAAREKAGREKAERERAERERAEREKARRAQEDREKAAREQADRDRAARETAAREKAARDRAEREKAVRERAEQDEAEQRMTRQAERVQAEQRAAEAARLAAQATPTRMQGPRAPRLFEAETPAPDAPLTPATAPPVPEPGAEGPPRGRAMQTMVALAARRPSRIARFFWSSMLALFGFILSVAAWDFVTGLLARNSFLGGVALTLVGFVLLAVLLVGLREMAAFSRLRRLDLLHKEADAAIAAQDLGQARTVVDHLLRFYGHRADIAWGRERLAERADEVFDADALLALTEQELLAPLDAAATREVEAAARTVATITALVPITLADLLAALTANLRMIRRVAEIYGGRGGVLGSLRLARSVLTHLVATGVVAVGDDMIGSIAGGGMLAKVSRRFGEGVVNGALTARVGVAAMEVCRPLPLRETRRPSVSALVKRALAGVFSKAQG